MKYMHQLHKRLVIHLFCFAKDCICADCSHLPLIKGPHFIKKIHRTPKNLHWQILLRRLSVLTSWYLETPPFTAASMTPLRHMVKGLMFCICLVWHWLIRAFSCWFLFSSTSIAFSRGLISTWKADECQDLLTFIQSKETRRGGMIDRQRNRSFSFWLSQGS